MLTFNSNIIPKTEGAFIVGGSIRDILANRIPNDYDFAVSKNPRDFALHIAEKTNGTVSTLKKPGLTLYRVSAGIGIFDVSPTTGDSIDEDLGKRDFTINAMAFDLAEGKLIDPFNGINDLKSGMVKMVSEQAFKDDPIRLLRAYRLCSQFKFSISDETDNAIGRNRFLIKNISEEHIHTELLRIFEVNNSFEYLQSMIDSRLIFEIIPELKSSSAKFKKNINAYFELEETLNSLNLLIRKSGTNMEINHSLLKLTILINAACCRRISNINDIQTESLAEKICVRLKFSKIEKDFVSFIINNYPTLNYLYSSYKEKYAFEEDKINFISECKGFIPELILYSMAINKSNKNNCPDEYLSGFQPFLEELLLFYFASSTQADNEVICSCK